MGGNGNAGRIHKKPFMVSTLLLLAICLISVAVRFYIRIGVQRQVSIDDGFLLFGFCCLISGMAVLLITGNLDGTYMATALIFDGVDETDLSSRRVGVSRFNAITQILTWLSIVSIKFSFLFLFRRLIDRIRPLVIYWWVVVIINVAIAGYGISGYFIACPYMDDERALQCIFGSRVWTTIYVSISQMILDIVSDVLILYIPIHLIWQIKIRWTQKAALAFSLCLTIVMIGVTIIRAAGLHKGNKFDPVWQTYWQVISAEIGVIMTALTAFRAFFVARSDHLAHDGERCHHQVGGQPHKPRQWISHCRQYARRPVSWLPWKSSSRLNSPTSTTDSIISDKAGLGLARVKHVADLNKELPSPPRAVLTGTDRFIDRQGRAVMRTVNTTRAELGTGRTSKRSTLAEDRELPIYYAGPSRVNRC